MKSKKLASMALCLAIAASINAPVAYAHHGGHHGGHHSGGYSYNYNYGYNYNYTHSCGHSYCINHGYDCSSYPEHAHPDGICPYNCADASYHYYKANTVKKVQNKLNRLGYTCGSADGVYGTQTKVAIKKFQKKKNVTVNGKINKALLKKLKLS